MRESGKTIKLEDRLLGDEWSDWQPGSVYEGVINAPRSLFIIFSCLVLICALLGISALWYLALPRLLQFGPNIARAAGIALLTFGIILSIWFMLQISSAVLRIGVASREMARRAPLISLLPWSIRLGGLFGISRDKMVNSYLKFHNDLMYATKTGAHTKNFLVLLPRCLASAARDEINEVCGRYNCNAFTAFGGDEARKIIREKRPSAVIGIACERDLISGIQDIAKNIPVLAIPNRRPDGPCKNTLIDVNELERIIRFCAEI